MLQCIQLGARLLHGIFVSGYYVKFFLQHSTAAKCYQEFCYYRLSCIPTKSVMPKTEAAN